MIIFDVYWQNRFMYFSRSVLSVLIICAVLTVASIILNHTFLRVIVGGPLKK